MPIFLCDVESSPNYTEKLIFAGIGTITLLTNYVNVADWPTAIFNFYNFVLLGPPFKIL
jgi:hypothetical protein